MIKKAVSSSELAPSVGPFSQAIEVNGFLYLSGQIGLDPTGKLVTGGIRSETERVFLNIAAVLREAGKGFDDVVRVGVFLTRMEDFQVMNAIYAGNFRQPFPARTTIGV